MHYPINYSQSISDSRALRKRMLNFLGPVTLFVIVFNITKFLDIEHRWIW